MQDETLVHCSITVLDKYDFSFQVSLGEDVYDVSAYMYVRTYLRTRLNVCLCWLVRVHVRMSVLVGMSAYT